MNKLEFTSVINTAINNNIMTNAESFGANNEVSYWKNHQLHIYHGPSYYAVVKGNIPYEVAKNLYDKYPYDQYGIRINGGVRDQNPEYVTVECYHIVTKEGLLAFITEMKDYESRKQGLPETAVADYHKLLGEIVADLLEKVKPNVSNDEIVKGLIGDKKGYQIAKINTQFFSMGPSIRNAIIEFDSAVNPFINNIRQLDTPENYTKKVNISIGTDDKRNEKDLINCSISITANNSTGMVTYRRSEKHFGYEVEYINDKGEKIEVYHAYISEGHGELGEFVRVYYLSEESPDYKKDFSYNINLGTIKYFDNKKNTITSIEELNKILDELWKASACARSITIENMTKRNNYQFSLKN